jgi:hypothetical protein
MKKSSWIVVEPISRKARKTFICCLRDNHTHRRPSGLGTLNFAEINQRFATPVRERANFGDIRKGRCMLPSPRGFSPAGGSPRAATFGIRSIEPATLEKVARPFRGLMIKGNQ